MKRLTIVAIFVLIVVQFASAAGRDFYQIQVYRLKGSAQEQRVDNYLKEAYLPALHRAGIKSVGVFKPIPADTTSGRQIIVWLPLATLDQLDKLQSALAKDVVYQKSGADVLNAPFDNVAFQRKESVILKAFRMPRIFSFQTIKPNLLKESTN